MKSWYEIKNLSTGVMKISLHDEIGVRGVTAGQFMQAVNSAGPASNIDIDIHSPGGNFLDGLAIYNFLSDYPAKIHASVRGVAGSASSLILMAGDTISMPEDAYIMIHRMQFNSNENQTYESDELRDIASTMDKFEQSAINIYQKRTGMKSEKLAEKMAITSWIGATEALSLGFIDNITGALGVAAKAHNFERYFNNMPFVEDTKPIDSISNIKDFERFLRDSGDISRATATKLASRAKVIFQSESDELPDADYKELETALMQVKIPKSLT